LKNRRWQPRTSKEHAPPADLALVFGDQPTTWVARLNNDG
jgi:hypothetical protein